MSENNFWGYHLMLDCHAAGLEQIKSKDNIVAFTKDLVQKIDMVAYGEPQVVNFGSGNKEGYTLVQLIETSNICGHFCNESGDFYLDIFSCKTFNPSVVQELVQQYFQPKNVKVNMVSRDAVKGNYNSLL